MKQSYDLGADVSSFKMTIVWINRNLSSSLKRGEGRKRKIEDFLIPLHDNR